jgi:hypothetical protein
MFYLGRFLNARDREDFAQKLSALKLTRNSPKEVIIT